MRQPRTRPTAPPTMRYSLGPRPASPPDATLQISAIPLRTMTTTPAAGRPRRTCAVAGPTGQDGHDVEAGDALGRNQRGDHGRDDRADEHPDHAGPGDLERADGEVGVAGLPPGEPGQGQEHAGDHGDGRRHDAQHDGLPEDVSPELARLRAVGGGERQ